MTKSTLYILTVSILMTSCASILNCPYKYITIHTTEPSEIIFEKDTIITIDNKVHLRVARKNEPISFVVTTDSLKNAIEIKPKNSDMFWANIYPGYGIGMLVDRKNPKRYTYPGNIWLIDTRGNYSRFGQANSKKEVYLHLSLPSYNIFRIKPENEETRVGIGLGISVGLDFFHSKKQFIHLGVSRNTGFAFHLFGSYENFDSDHIFLSNNHKIRQFSIGYGVSYTNNTWEYNLKPWFAPEIHKKTNHKAFGLIFPTYFQLGEYFNLGIVYRPTFYRPNAIDKFAYDHLISIDCSWKIRIKK